MRTEFKRTRPVPGISVFLLTVVLSLLCCFYRPVKADAAATYPTVYAGQDYSRVYNAYYYVKKYPSVLKTCKTKTQVLANFVKVGIPAGRQGCAGFDVKSYIYGNPGLRKVYKNDLAKYYIHFQKYGYRSRPATATGIKSMQKTWKVYDGVSYAAVYDYAYYAKTHPSLHKLYKYDDYGLLQYYVLHDYKKQVAARANVSSTAFKSTSARRQAAYLARTKSTANADQVILVVNHELSLWNKNSDGTWARQFGGYCGYGSNGLSRDRYEGDKTTPIGSFPILFAFGKAKNPGTALQWKSITPYSYYSGARNSTYNRWVESRTPIPGEHLTDYYQYEYAMSIGFNYSPTVIGKGSAIFLHVKSTDHWSTAGCVSVSRNVMINLITRAKSRVQIIIVPTDTEIVKY